MVGNDLRSADTVAGGVMGAPLLDRLAAAWPGLTDADRLAVVALAERPSVTNRGGVTVDG